MSEGAGSDPNILASDADWLVVDKPPGWLTIATSRPSQAGSPVLVEWLRKKSAVAGSEVWVVHRIDRETSGLVLFARSEEMHRQGSQWFQGHKIRKEYDCIAGGEPSAPVFKIREPIAGQPSSSQIEVRERFAGAFLARVIPVTGRRHQIRIHLAKAGYPICGDTRYRGVARLGGLEIPRVALHAARLELPDGRCFEAKWPEDFARWVEVLRGR